MHRHGRIGAARRHRRAGAHPDDGLGRGLTHGPRHALDLRDRDERLFFAPGRCAVLQFQVPPLDQPVGLLLGEGRLVDRLSRHKQVLAVLEVTDELLVPQPFGQQHMGDGTRERAIGTRKDRQPLVCLGGHVGEPRIDRDHGAALHDARELVHHVRHHAVGCQRVGAPAHQAVGAAQVVVTVAEETLGQTRAHLLGFGADRAVRKILAGPPDLGKRAIQQFGRGRRIASAHVDQLFRLAGLAQFHHLFGHDGECFVPGDRHELRVDAAPFDRVGALQGHLDAVRVVHLLRDQVSARAAVAVIGLGQRIAPHARRAAVLNENLNSAPLRAPLAGAGHPVSRGGTAGLCLARDQRAV